ncbi:MAG TPA: N-acetylmuramoyl-L-alanine amidase [Gammaproteobacteria bacterium]|nr:N-acetylmuramoyl-L-alanine amidase [Gammaproteobacteria bacterium]
MKHFHYKKLILLLPLLLLLLLFLPTEKNNYIIDDSHQAKTVGPRIQFIVIHFTHLNFADSLRVLTQNQVSSHYLVPEEPINGQDVIYQLVDDDLKAAHAGLSYWQGQERDGQININASSIGIEIVNLGYRDSAAGRHWHPYTEHQINLVTELLKDLIEKYDIDPTRIIGHAEITPNIAARGNNTRIDPGPLFPWEELAAVGIGAWYDREVVEGSLKDPAENEIDILSVQKNLAKYGYNIETTGVLDEQTRNVLVAFQMHFQPHNYSGVPDQETDAILRNLIDKYFPEEM